jgi:hypothetical protein
MISKTQTIRRGISGARWRLQPDDSAAIDRLQRDLREDDLLLRCLINRGITDPLEARSFLAPQFESHLYNPELLRDMVVAVARLRRAVSAPSTPAVK